MQYLVYKHYYLLIPTSWDFWVSQFFEHICHLGNMLTFIGDFESYWDAFQFACSEIVIVVIIVAEHDFEHVEIRR